MNAFESWALEQTKEALGRNREGLDIERDPEARSLENRDRDARESEALREAEVTYEETREAAIGHHVAHEPEGAELCEFGVALATLALIVEHAREAAQDALESWQSEQESMTHDSDSEGADWTMGITEESQDDSGWTLGPAQDEGANDEGANDEGANDEGANDEGANDEGANDAGPNDSGPNDAG
ncbi:MAG: hypothetical protein JNK85_27050, partial [Verrucomicrobiales bacterium]|nr:hypothetical protein [Verrucomicrobiales bacterium]